MLGIKKGAKKWMRSRRYQRMREKKADLDRQLAEQRSHLQGKLCNEILWIGSKVVLEKLNDKSFQKR